MFWVNMRFMKQEQSLNRAMLFARLASLPSLDEISEAEKNSLIASAREARFRWLDFEHQGKSPFVEKEKKLLTGPEGARDWMSLVYYRRTKGQPKATYWDALKVAHEKGRPLILDLLKKGTADLRPLNRLVAPLLQTHIDHASRQQFIVTELWPNPTLEEEILHALIQFLRQPRCLLRLCPICGQVFVPIRGQRYCSRKCLTHGVETSRKESRREYMRKYMAKRRKDTGEPKPKKRKTKAA